MGLGFRAWVYKVSGVGLQPQQPAKAPITKQWLPCSIARPLTLGYCALRGDHTERLRELGKVRITQLA